ncbi:MAG: DUF86 domain-containing protein [Deltaproteobacteria bacterium]|nr:DUF86 domain-containing protein [Deltaproteobacteria bacterium]
MVDQTLILRKLSNLEAYLVQIEEYRTISLEAYLNDWKTQRIIERTLQMMVETCSDIAGHIIADHKYRVPTGYADTFQVLEENKVLDKTLAESLSKMAKFRNVVVHDYDQVDGEIVIGILRKYLPDFSSFKDAVVALL